MSPHERRQLRILKNECSFWSSFLPAVRAALCVHYDGHYCNRFSRDVTWNAICSVNKSQLASFFCDAPKKYVQDEKYCKYWTLLYDASEGLRQLFFLRSSLTKRTFSWRSNDMTVIEVSLRQIYQAANRAEKGDIYGDLKGLDPRASKFPEVLRSQRIWWIDLKHWCILKAAMNGFLLPFNRSLSIVIDLAFCYYYFPPLLRFKSAWPSINKNPTSISSHSLWSEINGGSIL